MGFLEVNNGKLKFVVKWRKRYRLPPRCPCVLVQLSGCVIRHSEFETSVWQHALAQQVLLALI
jgi:hypothetical protein